MISIQGVLITPDGALISGAIIRFQTQRNTGLITVRTQSDVTTDSVGGYTIDLNTGSYAVAIAYDGKIFTPVGNVQIFDDSVNGTLNSYLIKNYDPVYVQDVLTQLAAPGGVDLVNGALDKAENLSDVSSVSTSRTNLQVYSKNETDAAIAAGGGGDVSGKMDKSANLSDVVSVSQARTNLDVLSSGQTTALIPSLTPYLQKADNLAALTDKTVSRTNLVVYSKTEVDAKIPDITGKMDKSANLSDVVSITSAQSNLQVYSKTQVDTSQSTQDTSISAINAKLAPVTITTTALNPTTDNTMTVGASALRFSTLYAVKHMFTATVGQFSGSGSPEGSITGGIASMYYRTDGANGSYIYLKTSGTGNTGWTAIA